MSHQPGRGEARSAIHSRPDWDNFGALAQAPLNCGDNYNNARMIFGEAGVY